MKKLHSYVVIDFAIVLVAGGMLLIALEFCRPGWVWPGVLGGVAVVHGGSSMPLLPLAALLASAGISMAAGWLGWPRWTAAMAGIAAVGTAAQFEAGWVSAAFCALPAPALYWLLTAAAKAAANKTIVG
ncbi:MAG: hypothetical protein FJW38_12025 [Acidobacteria bacterium]|nr:hypothetical protein [Acidobacteriota bacterium]